MSQDSQEFVRYDRQVTFAPYGLEGQRRLMRSSALIVGIGGLGSWVAELLARAGVGRLRLVDFDCVDLTNLHRQALYTQADADANRPKALAAAEHLAAINSQVAIEATVDRVNAGNIERLAGGIDLIVDGTDNFPTRFVLNDFAVKVGLPWVFAGVVGAEAQLLTVLPGRTPCLRCVYDSPPPPCISPTCRSAGVLGPAVAAVAAMQAMEAMKILAGRADDVRTGLLKIDFWTNCIRQLSQAVPSSECPCCGLKRFDYLDE